MTKFHQPYEVSSDFEFGSVEATPEPKLFAFSMQDGQARTSVFSEDADGKAALAMLLRSETVVTVVRGHEVIVTNESLLTIRMGSESFQDRYQKLGL